VEEVQAFYLQVILRSQMISCTLKKLLPLSTARSFTSLSGMSNTMDYSKFISTRSQTRSPSASKSLPLVKRREYCNPYGLLAIYNSVMLIYDPFFSSCTNEILGRAGDGRYYSEAHYCSLMFLLIRQFYVIDFPRSRRS
jgi:hypothetical protein